MQLDRKLMETQNIDLTTPMVITNSDQFQLKPIYGNALEKGISEAVTCILKSFSKG